MNLKIFYPALLVLCVGSLGLSEQKESETKRKPSLYTSEDEPSQKLDEEMLHTNSDTYVTRYIDKSAHVACYLLGSRNSIAKTPLGCVAIGKTVK